MKVATDINAEYENTFLYIYLNKSTTQKIRLINNSSP